MILKYYSNNSRFSNVVLYSIVLKGGIAASHTPRRRMTQDAARPAEDVFDDDALSDEEEELDDEVQRPFTNSNQSNATILCDAWRIPALNELGMPLQKKRGKRSDIWSDDICLVVTEEAVQAAINSGKQFDLSRIDSGVTPASRHMMSSSA